MEQTKVKTELKKEVAPKEPIQLPATPKSRPKKQKEQPKFQKNSTVPKYDNRALAKADRFVVETADLTPFDFEEFPPNPSPPPLSNILKVSVLDQQRELLAQQEKELRRLRKDGPIQKHDRLHEKELIDFVASHKRT